MPTPSFSKDITSIFNSNDLKDELKYDITCRLVCEALEVATVSMLIYDAQIDKLRCKGNYIAPYIRSKYIVENFSEIGNIVENICVFEYFDSEISDMRNTNFSNFKKSIIYGETNTNYKISQEDFESLKTLWVNNTHKKMYVDYKTKIHNEIHSIDNSTLSGKYFSKLLGFGKKLTSEIENSVLTDGPQKGESFFKTWKTANISVPSEELYYIGLPLFATERYTGIIRITAFKTPKSTIQELFESTDTLERDLQIERLNNFAQLISLHLKTNYYLDGFRVLSNLEIDSNNNIKIDNDEIDSICNILTSVIRCNGCIIRLTNNSFDRQNPPIRGVSETLREYLNYINQNTTLTFSEDIYGLLKSKNKDENDIKAINFSIPDNSDTDFFETNEYYYDNDDRLDYNIHPGRQFRDFTPEYINLLRKFNMKEIVVLRLEFLEAGFMVLTNTVNRKFTNSDIEMVLLASKRIGLEIKHHQDTERIKEQNKIIAQEEHARLIVHQIGAPVRALSGHAQNLDEKVFKEHEMPTKITQLNKMSFALLRQINSLQKYLDWEVKPITAKNESIYHLQNYIRSRAIQFEGLTVGTKLRIWTIIDNPDSFYDYCNLERGLLDEILNCLLDNAVKYSYSDYEMSKYGLLFNPKDPLSEGHIHIKVNSIQTKLVITVENYGSSIDEKEYFKIFERGTRGKSGKKKSPIGSGIGLYLAKKVTLALKGTIDVFHDKLKSKTSFQVTLPL